MATGPSAGQCKDDDSNKAVILGNRGGFAYTGLAAIGRVKTDLWLAQTLADARARTLSDACAAIESRATEAFRRIRDPQIKRHAFVGVGWARYQTDGPVVPVICVVSNALDEDGEWLGKAHPRFITRFYGMADDSRVMLRTTGQYVGLKEKHYILRNAYKCILKGVGPETILTLLADRIRRVADRNPTVGKNLMALSLPIGSADSDMYAATMSLPQPNVPSFCYLPENETNFVQGSPWVVNEYFIGQLQSSWVQPQNTDQDP